MARQFYEFFKAIELTKMLIWVKPIGHLFTRTVILQ
jgi:hypothetical protein